MNQQNNRVNHKNLNTAKNAKFNFKISHFYTLIVVGFATSLLLTGCGEKNAKYFYNHPEELGQVINDCQNRSFSYFVEDKRNYLYSAERINIKNENELNYILGVIDNSISRLTSLRDDKLCQEAAIAKKAVDTGNLKAAQMNGISIWTQTLDPTIQQLKQAKTFLQKQYDIKTKYAAMTFEELDAYYNDPTCKSWGGTRCTQQEYYIISELWKEKRKPIVEARTKALEALSWDEFNQLSSKDCKELKDLDCELIPEVRKIQNEQKISDFVHRINNGKHLEVYTEILKGWERYCNNHKNFDMCGFYDKALSVSREKIGNYLETNEAMLKQEYNRCYVLAQTWTYNQLTADFICNKVRFIASDKYSNGNGQLEYQLTKYSDKIENLIGTLSK